MTLTYDLQIQTVLTKIFSKRHSQAAKFGQWWAYGSKRYFLETKSLPQFQSSIAAENLTYDPKLTGISWGHYQTNFILD